MTANALENLPLEQFSTTLPIAEGRAWREAAETAGIVLRIMSIRIETNRIVLTGLIPSGALAFEHPGEFPAYLQPRSIGNLHLTASSLRSNGGGEVGYLVLHTPVTAEGLLPESEEGDAYWVALAVEPVFHSLRRTSSGPLCCARCNRPVPSQRLLAVPNTKVCLND
jgi:hypothetical protein